MANTLSVEQEPLANLERIACLNCGENLVGQFCYRCGQEAAEPIPRLRELVFEFLDEFLKLDSRVPRTVRALFYKPGQLTLDYAEGRKASMLTPFKLYFASSFIFYFLIDQLGLLDFAKYIKFAADSTSAEQRGLIAGLTFYFEHLATVSILVLPFSALGLALVFRDRKRPFIFHLVGTLHIVSATFLMSIPVFLLVILAINVFHSEQAAVAMGLLFAVGVGTYQQTAIRRIYNASKWESRWKYSLSNIFSSVISVVTLVVIISSFVIKEQKRDSQAATESITSKLAPDKPVKIPPEVSKALELLRHMPWAK